ncbi:NAD(+) diphosphatase [Demequina capsici]|uniref:NAD(+) diphosphatase n=1 Tax=Demequina capsici TaxID=3075620 RepID=A0AA96FCA8_9MICO|nr:NAD(+) diphosphatase [Demequina sp. PMTSA13]WNM26755.1 NAD(+) diphosphatase [Demequina sp. PMTSA13]
MSDPWSRPDPLIVDRATELRDSADLDAATAIVVTEGRLLASAGRLVELPPAEHPEARLRVYLGRENGRDLIAIVPADPSFADGYDGIGGERLVGLRDLLQPFAAHGAEGLRDRELGSTAVALEAWHASHGHCARCGAATEPVKAGWVRRCPADGREHYPRVDPAVIVAIVDEADRLLLAHAAHWSPKRFSILAGYVEPGETFEQAVHREVWEESGIELTHVAYAGSQPWPFPASVMVGFTARTDATEPSVDGEEITEARFVSREEIVALVADGEVVLAPHGSIARRLIESWFGGPITDPAPDERIDV